MWINKSSRQYKKPNNDRISSNDTHLFPKSDGIFVLDFVYGAQGPGDVILGLFPGDASVDGDDLGPSDGGVGSRFRSPESLSAFLVDVGDLLQNHFLLLVPLFLRQKLDFGPVSRVVLVGGDLDDDGGAGSHAGSRQQTGMPQYGVEKRTLAAARVADDGDRRIGEAEFPLNGVDFYAAGRGRKKKIPDSQNLISIIQILTIFLSILENSSVFLFFSPFLNLFT